MQYSRSKHKKGRDVCPKRTFTCVTMPLWIPALETRLCPCALIDLTSHAHFRHGLSSGPRVVVESEVNRVQLANVYAAKHNKCHLLHRVIGRSKVCGVAAWILDLFQTQ